MDTRENDATDIQEGPRDESIVEPGDGANAADDQQAVRFLVLVYIHTFDR